jgi:hypothetical protein
MNESPIITDVKSLSLEDIWGFLESSGFIYPEKRKIIDFEAAKATLSKLISGDSDVFKGLAVTRGSSIYAHISTVRIYDKVWMVQHMASLPYKREKVSHAMMLNLSLLEYFEQSSNVEWVRATYRHENKRVSRLYESLAAQVSNPELSIVQFMNCMKSDKVYDLVMNGLEVVPLPDTFSGGECFDHVSSGYEKIGLERRQKFLGVYRSGELVGYSALEISSPGLNLSELTSAFRVFMNTSDPEALSILIRSSSNYYKSLGYRNVIALVSDDDVAKFEALGFEQFKRYTFWTWHQSLCRQFHEYIGSWKS